MAWTVVRLAVARAAYRALALTCIEKSRTSSRPATRTITTPKAMNRTSGCCVPRGASAAGTIGAIRRSPIDPLDGELAIVGRDDQRSEQQTEHAVVDRTRHEDPQGIPEARAGPTRRGEHDDQHGVDHAEDR